MEFKYRAADENPSNFPVLSPNQSYFTEQATRAGYLVPPIHRGPGFPCPNDYYQNPLAMHQAMLWREAEKEKIREEIIAEEIGRRRMLEAEVRHELMIERDSAMRIRGNETFYSSSLQAMRFEPHGIQAPSLLHRAEGRLICGNIPMSFEERVGMSITQKTEFGAFDSNPFNPRMIQEPRISEIDPASEISNNKEKIVFLVKPEENLCGAKRKAECSLTMETNEVSSDNARKKMVEEWSCSICQVSASSERNLNDHLTGKKHKAKELALKKKEKKYKIGLYPKKTANPNNQDNVAESESEKETKNQILDTPMKKQSKGRDEVNQKKKKRFRFWCETCEIGVFSEIVMEGHKMGKKHIAKLQEVNQTSQKVHANKEEEACKNGENAEIEIK